MFSSSFVDQWVQTKDLDYFDRENAKHLAKEKVHEGLEELANIEVKENGASAFSLAAYRIRRFLPFLGRDWSR